MEAIKVKKLRPAAVMPTFGSAEAAGADLYACLEADVDIRPGETRFIPTGLAMALPKGYAGLVYARSGLACKQDLAPANKVGVIDSDYRGGSDHPPRRPSGPAGGDTDPAACLRRD